MRAVFDVNVLLRGAMGSALIAKLLERAGNSEFAVLGNVMLRTEFGIAAGKTRLAHRLEESAHRVVTRLLEYAIEPVDVVLPFPACRDPKDGYLLAIARDGDANFLVTNDQDLLCLSPFGKCEIVTPEDFLRRLCNRTSAK